MIHAFVTIQLITTYRLFDSRGKSPIKKRIKLLWIWLLAISAISLTACQSLSNIRANTPAANSVPTDTVKLPVDWSRRWLKGTPCFAPCWEGVTPGLTNANDAVIALQKSSWIATARLLPIPNGRDYGTVSWSRIDGKDGGEAYYLTQTLERTIFEIHPLFGETFRLSDVMHTYGYPSHVFATASRTPDVVSLRYDLWIVYVSEGFALNAASTIKPDAASDGIFTDVRFFSPTIDGFRAAIGSARAHPDWLVPWQNNQGFDYYCRDGQNGNICRGE